MTTRRRAPYSLHKTYYCSEFGDSKYCIFMKTFLIKILVLTLLIIPIVVGAYTSPGSPTGHVNDFAGMLQPEQKQQLEAKLSTYKQNTSHEIAVVTVDSI